MMMRLVVSGSLLAVLLLWLAVATWLRRRKDRRLQKRFMALRLHRIAGGR